MKNISVKFIAESAIIAALYAGLTWILAPISYGPVQFRIAEVLVLLCVLNPKYSVALVLGCFVANTTSSLGWYDMVFGTLATLVAVIPMCFVKKMPIAAIFPVISNAFIVSFELGLAFELWGGAFWYDVLTVGVGELVVLYALGLPLMYGVAKNQMLCEVMELDVSHMEKLKFVTLPNTITVVLGVLGIILFVAYPLATEIVNDAAVNYSAMSMVPTMWYTVLYAVFSLVFGLTVFLKNKWLKLIGMVTSIVGILVVFILTGVFNPLCVNYIYYYGYITFILILILASVLLTMSVDKKEEVEFETSVTEEA